MNLYSIHDQIQFEILLFLNWNEYYDVVKELKIQLRLEIYNKYNNSMYKLTINDVCKMKREYLEIVQYLYYHNTLPRDWNIGRARLNGHLKIVKFAHSIGITRYTHTIDNAKMRLGPTAKNAVCSYGNLDIVKYLHSIKTPISNMSLVCAKAGQHHDVIEFLESIQ